MKTLRTTVLGAFALTLLLAATPPDSPVADAAMKGDREAALQLVREGADVNAAQGDGMTALHWAAHNGDAELAEVLVHAGANLEAVTRIGAHRPIHVASRAGFDPIVTLLLGAGADPDAATTNGVTALHYAAAAGSTDAVRALLDAGVQVDVREPYWGHTPLMLAAARNRPAAVRLLIERGADPALAARLEPTSARQEVDGAARQARSQVLDAFQQQAVNPETWRPGPAEVRAAVLAARAVEERAPLAAVENAEAADGDVYGGLTALLLAVRDGNEEAVAALVEGGADPNQVRPGDRTSPMLLAAINGHYDLVKYFLEHGGDPNLASIRGATPLYAVINKEWAPRSRHPQPTYHRQQTLSYLEVMEELLRAGANPNARLGSDDLWYTSPGQNNLGVDFLGATPLFRAAHAVDLAAIKLLMAFGGDPSIATHTSETSGGRGGRGGRGGGGGGDEPDPSGLPPVPPGGLATPVIVVAAGAGYGLGYAANDHVHAPGGWMPVMRFLVEELGHDVNARDARGFTPLHFAAARGDNELIEYLVSKGADATAVARTGQTTADMANGPFQRIPPYPETVALLERLGSKNNNRCLSC